MPRLRRGRVPASATASGVRVVDVPAPLEPRLRRGSRARVPRAACSRRGSGVRGARAPRAVCSSSECRAPAERAAPASRAPRGPCARVECVAPSPSERRGGRARVECAVCSRRACRGCPWPCARVERAGVLASRERSWPCLRRVCRARGARAAVLVSSVRRPRALAERAVQLSRSSSECRVPALAVPSCSCPSPERRVLVVRVPRSSCSWRTCRGARVDRAAVAAPVVRVPRLRRASGRARAPRAVVVCPRRGSRRALAERAAVVCPSSECGRARRPSAAVVCPRRSSRVLVSIEPPWCARVEGAAAPVARVRRCGARVERAAVLALRVPRQCASAEGAVAHEPRERPPAPSPRVPPCPRRGSGTLVPWAPCPNGGRAFAERAALIVSHR